MGGRAIRTPPTVFCMDIGASRMEYAKRRHLDDSAARGWPEPEPVPHELAHEAEHRRALEQRAELRAEARLVFA